MRRVSLLLWFAVVLYCAIVDASNIAVRFESHRCPWRLLLDGPTFEYVVPPWQN